MFKTLTYTEAQTKMYGPRGPRESEFDQVKDTPEACATFVRVCRRELCELTEEPTGDFRSGWFGKRIWVGIWIITEEDDGTLTATRDGNPLDFTMKEACDLGVEVEAGIHGCNSGMYKGRHDHGPCEHGVHGQ